MRVRKTSPLVACVLALGLLCSCGHEPEGGPGRTTSVKRGRFEVNIVEDGYLKALHSATITAKESGKIEWLAGEGIMAEKGQELVRLERKEQEEQLERHRSELKEAEAQLQELQEGFDKEKEDLQDGLSGLELSLELARLRLEMLLKRPLPADKAKAEADLKRREVLMKDAEAERSRRQKLLEAKAVSHNDVRQADMLAKVAKARYERQKMFYTELNQGATPLEVEKAKLDIEMAELGYEVAKDRTESQIARLQESIERAEASVARYKSHCRRTETHLENRILCAPHRGMVIYYQRPRWSSSRDKRKVDVGTSVWTGAAIIELPDLEHMKVRSQVSESSIRHVAVGKPATIQVDREEVADQTYHGKVAWIDRTGRDRNSRLEHADRHREGLAGINVFDIEIAIDEKDPRLKLGDKARVRLLVQAYHDVAYVSKEAIRFEDRRPVVWILSEGKKRAQLVELGEENETDVIITKGLSGGETVLLR